MKHFVPGIDNAPVAMPVRYQDREISLMDLIRDCTTHASDSRTSSRQTSAKTGKGQFRSGAGTQQSQLTHLDFPGTIRAAAPWQPVRDMNKGRTPAVHLEQQDLRFRHERGTESVSVLFVVDASRSQGAQKRLSFAKGAVCQLLRQVYCERCQAGLIIFGNRRATLALPFTRSVEYAAKQLESLPASGNTPLAMGLRLAIRTILAQKQKNESEKILLILLTDGKGNYDEWPGDPLTLSEEVASQIRQMDIPAIVIDTETGPFRLELAKQLAETMNARYLTL